MREYRRQAVVLGRSSPGVRVRVLFMVFDPRISPCCSAVGRPVQAPPQPNRLDPA